MNQSKAQKSKKKSATIPLNDSQKEFYAYLGLLSVRFAEMENHLTEIVSKLISKNEEVIAAILIEDTLHKNLELLKKLNKVRDFEAIYIDRMISSISSIKGIRNLFIHGVWSDPMERQNDIISYCNDVRMTYHEEKDKSGKGVIKTWKMNDHKEFRLSYLIQQIHTLNDILFVQTTLLKKIENDFDPQL